MPHRKRMTRRRFLLMGGGTVLSAFIGGAYLRSGCPLSSSGVCVGPCAAFLDLNHDGICDRIQSTRSLSDASASDGVSGAQLLPGHAQDAGQAVEGCPFGLVDDPYPGKCGRYVDENGDGFCDLSQLAAGEPPCTAELTSAAASVSEPTPSPAPENVVVACPFGLVNDPYPGKCKRYVDKNGNGFCDLSEPEPTPVPEPAAVTESVPHSTPTPAPDSVTVACPFGLVNDPYPGECKRYVDRNGNGFCDLSEPGSGENEPQDVPTAREGEGRRRRGRGGGE